MTNSAARLNSIPNNATSFAADCADSIGALPLWRKTVTLDIRTSEIEACFLADPALPGVIVNAGAKPIGLLSRQNLLAAISQPFGREVFIKRPVSEMIKSIDTAPLALPAGTPIAAALKQAMARQDAIRFEPLLVRHENFVGLLEVPELLTAQATLLEATLTAKDALIGEIERTTAELRVTLEAQARLAAQLSAAREVAQHEATHDGLTGLPNRKLFLEILEATIASQRAGELQDCAVLFIDLDRFKLVNDSLGHAAGNDLLVEVAVRLGQVVRQAPTGAGAGPARPADTVARLSGDEFAVLLVNQRQRGAENGVAGRLLADLARPFTVQGVTVHISASIGILAPIAAYDSTEAILRDADIAMYQAKRHGKARAVSFEPSMREQVEQRLHTENSLREAILREAFIVHYQPIVDLYSAEIFSAEALVRWQLPAALVYPEHFIGLAEETGLIVPLGNWVFRKVCEAALALQENLPASRNVQFSINLSQVQFSQDALCDNLAEMLSLAGIDPGCLILEISERAAMTDPERTLATLKKLKSIGLKLAIDDFGAGYSSLGYLHRFPIDILKIDRSFIADLETSADALKIVGAIQALAKSLDIEVIAKGVETAFQRDQLLRLGCRLAQGSYFGWPMPQGEIAAMLQAARGG